MRCPGYDQGEGRRRWRTRRATESGGRRPRPRSASHGSPRAGALQEFRLLERHGHQLVGLGALDHCYPPAAAHRLRSPPTCRTVRPSLNAMNLRIPTSSWHDVVAADPQFADQVRRTFAVRKRATLATLRRDESPRSSGTEVDFAADGNLYLGRMPCSLKALDLRCDPRLALHCRTEDNPADHPAACWATARWPVRRWGLRSQPGRSAAPLPHRRDRRGPHQRRRGR